MVKRRRKSSDFQAEIEAHLQLEANRLREEGMSEEEARLAARRSFGNVAQAQERFYESGRWLWWDHLRQDVRFGLRQLRRTPGFTAIAILILALGIGANTAIFSVVNAVLLRPLPYQDPDRLVVILRDGRNPVAPANFIDWQKQNHVFDSVGAAEAWGPNLTGVDGTESVTGMRVTAGIFPMLGIRPILGRFFLAEEDSPGKEHEVLLDYGFWQTRFGGDSKIVGRSMTLDGEKYTVIGVMPRDFKFALFWVRRAELWAPLALGNRAANRGGNSLRIFARLKPGITLEKARAEMTMITARLEKQYPGTNRDVTVLPFKEKVVGDIRSALLVLLGAVGFVLLIACANVAHMQLGRAAVRRREIAVRAALGAGRGRMVAQLVTESLLLAMCGGGLGLALAVCGTRVLVALGPASLPRWETIGVDGRVLLFMLGVSALTGIGFGIVPALRASVPNLHDSLKEGGRVSAGGPRRSVLRSLLAASELALALTLLVGAGLMIRSLWALQTIDPGFNPHHLLTMVVKVKGSEVASAPRRAAFYQQLLQQIRVFPGVRSASAINHLPLAGDIWGWPYWIEGRPIPPPGEDLLAVYRVVMPDYFRSMNIPVLQGRDISPSDDLNAPGVVIVNERLARERWPGEDAIGKHISMNDPTKNPSWLTVVGVVKNAKQQGWAETPDDEVYLPYLQNKQYLEDASGPFSYLTLVVRTSAEPGALAPALRNEVWSLQKSVTVSEVQTMDQVVSASTVQPRFYLFLLGTFAAVALILAAAGIYGVMSYSVSQRTHEIGIRMALGANRGDVLKLVTGQGLALALAGAAVGLAGALLLTRLMSSLLYGIRPRDPLTFVAVSVLLIAVAFLASYIPARRATTVDPMVALRYE